MTPGIARSNVPTTFRRHKPEPFNPGAVTVTVYVQTAPRRCGWLRALLTPRYRLPHRIGPRGARKLRGNDVQ